jgi:hypothetical protein
MHMEQSKTQVTRELTLSRPVSSLIQSCVDSAIAILKTLRALADEDLIGEISRHYPTTPSNMISQRHSCLSKSNTPRHPPSFSISSLLYAHHSSQTIHGGMTFDMFLTL